MDIRPDRPDFRPERRRQRLAAAQSDGEQQRPAAERLANQTKAARIEQARIEKARAEAARTDDTRPLVERMENAEVDRVDLSEGARAAERLTRGGTSPDRLEALRELFQSGRLNSPERIEAAAQRILGRPSPFDPA